jgi:quercetin dioxygenase-like cupin family protein
MLRKPNQLHARTFVIAGVVALCIAVVAPLAAQEHGAAHAPEPARAGPPILLQAPLADAPGKNLVVVELNFPPNPGSPSTAENHPRGHRHPGSVYVYVTHGAVRLAVEGGPVQVIEAGGSFFEPVGAHHIIAENASTTEAARMIAVMIVPEGAPLATPDPE